MAREICRGRRIPTLVIRAEHIRKLAGPLSLQKDLSNRILVDRWIKEFQHRLLALRQKPGKTQSQAI
jgi:hypothetical protein